jgi:hypothetical protein
MRSARPLRSDAVGPIIRYLVFGLWTPLRR